MIQRKRNKIFLTWPLNPPPKKIITRDNLGTTRQFFAYEQFQKIFQIFYLYLGASDYANVHANANLGKYLYIVLSILGFYGIGCTLKEYHLGYSKARYLAKIKTDVVN